MLDITKINEAINTLSTLLDKYEITQLERMVGQGVIKFYEDKAHDNYTADLATLNIDMNLNVDQADYEDIPF
jgi:hypothetical protein